MFYKKLDEDDILEILIEYYQEQFSDVSAAKGLILGEPGKNLRFIGAFSDEDFQYIHNLDLNKLDKEIDFNGDHQFLKDNPDFTIDEK
jgi:hypothetical protein